MFEYCRSPTPSPSVVNNTLTIFHFRQIHQNMHASWVSWRRSAYAMCACVRSRMFARKFGAHKSFRVLFASALTHTPDNLQEYFIHMNVQTGGNVT